MSDHLHDRLVEAVGDHYLVEAELGRGGMAVVFRALDVRLNRRVAIKLLPPELAFNASVRARFMREAQMAAQLTHPNIVPIYTVDERAGLVFFVMALVDGESIAARLHRAGAFELSQVRAIVADVADALDYAHRQGVVHRDIKPDNILLESSSGRPMVTDFGIARAAAEESRLTVTGVAVGTPAYMSPEQAMGERELDGRSDIYSLGVVGYQMLAGETPFRASNTPAMLMKHVSEPPPPLRGRRPDIPASLASAIERALAKRPEDRWQSAGEMRDAVLLDRIVEPGRAPRDIPSVPSVPPIPLPAAPALWQWNPMPPEGLSRRERRDWYRDQRHHLRDAVRAGLPVPEQPVERKIARFRRSILRYAGLSVMLAFINGITSPAFPWAVFPILGFMVSLLTQFGALWGDGVPLRQVLFGPSNQRPQPQSASGSALPSDHAGVLATPEVLAGAHGAAIRRASASRQAVAELLSRMKPSEREMLPSDLEVTADALVDRVASLGATLHRLDADASGGMLGSLDRRVAALKQEASTHETERRLALLERQRSTLRDLLERRSALHAQMESASIALENLKLDLVRFRSAGVSSALEDVTSATREARAVSRDIGHMLDAADEVRRL